jgi:glycosyltransferase involved in cell wall biosynthesis
MTRVLFCYRSDVDTKGGAAVMIEETAAALRVLGVEVDVAYETLPDATGYDLVHAFNVWSPYSALEQLRHLRGYGVPVVWTPIYLHWDETAWVIPAVRAIYQPEHAARRPELLRLFAEGKLEVNGMTRRGRNDIIPDFALILRQMADLVDHVFVFSAREVQTLFQTADLVEKPFTVLPHGVSTQEVADASPVLFQDQFGQDDFVLCVGAVDSRKNQLLLAEALRETSLRLVLVGPSFERDYLDLCTSLGAVHIDRLPRDVVFSCYHAARAHVLPSFAEGSALANLEAAAARCPVVVSNRTSEFEYYLDLAYYCDPASVDSIRTATLAAAASRGHERWDRLAERIATYTWDRMARATLATYEQLLSAERRIDGARSFVVSVLADDLLAQPALLDEYAAQFAADDDATLAIETAAGQLPALEAAVRGLEIDMIALDRVPAGAAHAVYGRGLSAAELRGAAERHWAAAG